MVRAGPRHLLHRAHRDQLRRRRRRRLAEQLAEWKLESVQPRQRQDARAHQRHDGGTRGVRAHPTSDQPPRLQLIANVRTQITLHRATHQRRRLLAARWHLRHPSDERTQPCWLESQRALIVRRQTGLKPSNLTRTNRESDQDFGVATPGYKLQSVAKNRILFEFHLQILCQK